MQHRVLVLAAAIAACQAATAVPVDDFSALDFVGDDTNAQPVVDMNEAAPLDFQPNGRSFPADDTPSDIPTLAMQDADNDELDINLDNAQAAPPAGPSSDGSSSDGFLPEGRGVQIEGEGEAPTPRIFSFDKQILRDKMEHMKATVNKFLDNSGLAGFVPPIPPLLRDTDDDIPSDDAAEHDGFDTDGPVILPPPMAPMPPNPGFMSDNDMGPSPPGQGQSVMAVSVNGQPPVVIANPPLAAVDEGPDDVENGDGVATLISAMNPSDRDALKQKVCEMEKRLGEAQDINADRMASMMAEMQKAMPRIHMRNTLPATVQDFKQDAFMGRWYQMYTSPFLQLSFEGDGKCVTLDYLRNAKGGITLTTTKESENEQGELERDEVAGAVTSVSPGKMRVLYGTSLWCMGVAQWVVGAGPIENGQYQYALITGPMRHALFVLARDPRTFDEKYGREVEAAVSDFGFFGTAPVKISHDDCHYTKLAAEPKTPMGEGAGEEPAKPAETAPSVDRPLVVMGGEQDEMDNGAVQSAAPTTTVAMETPMAAETSLAAAPATEVVDKNAVVGEISSTEEEEDGGDKKKTVSIVLEVVVFGLLGLVCLIVGAIWLRRRQQGQRLRLSAGKARLLAEPVNVFASGCAYCSEPNCTHVEKGKAHDMPSI